MAKGRKAKKTKAPRKPQPLPKSVTALLKYLGGSDVRIGSSRPQPAQLAPTAINIAVTQQQQQFVKQRVAPVTGQVIGKSPLASVIPQQPVIVQQAPSTAETERKIREQARIADTKSNELNRKLGLLEISQKDFEKQAGIAYRNVKEDIARRVIGDANPFDATNVAQRFSSRPIIEEPQFAGMSFESGGGVGKSSGSSIFQGALEEEAAEGLGIYLQEKYVTDVSSPEMTPIRRGGRPRKTEEEKKATRQAYQERKKMEKQLQYKLTSPELASSASLLETRAPTTLSSLGESTAPAPVKKIMLKLKKKSVSTEGAPDMATQIALLTGGGSVMPPQSQGKTIAEMLGSKK